ncbi:hypothetical protein [Allohahella sp. A8]|uniref:hypothetical protein n=1 Tax=Allohahella sp. A8 TaxID=3141461 RepID=UPI000C09E158|nr:hypothetical protein [Hahellaceae bacterium]|tara:strand:- start:22912 stop:23310 length:399 start_codon:yes stop_codon:yes gene_type:complete
MTDAIAAMSFDLVMPAGQAAPDATAQASVYDISRFEAAFEKVADKPTTAEAVETAGDSPFKAAFKALDSLNGGVESVGQEAMRILGNKAEMSPSEMIGLTMKAHHFLFQSQLTANIANKSSEGLQQLFRQQG